MSSKNPTNSSPTAQKSPDNLGLGRTSGQRGAEILAGIRAELNPSPITKALSRLGGTLIARMMIKIMGRGKGAAGFNFIAVRTQGFASLILDALPKDKKEILIVEIAAGFSPRGLELAKSLPDATIIEIDLPDVVQQKQARLRFKRDVVIPDNVHWRSADMGVEKLDDVLEGKKPHAIAAEGLLPYFPREQQVKICREIYDSLAPDGVFVADFSWKKGLEIAREGTRFFSRQAGQLSGLIAQPEEAESIFKEAGFETVEILLPSVVAERHQLPTPVSDFQLFVLGRKSSAPSTDT